VETQAISRYGNFSKIIANSKCEALNPKQITEKGFCCSFLGMAARMVYGIIVGF
jgi:hypothetical protein